jgi:hypothetical protein
VPRAGAGAAGGGLSIAVVWLVPIPKNNSTVCVSTFVLVLWLALVFAALFLVFLGA